MKSAQKYSAKRRSAIKGRLLYLDPRCLTRDCIGLWLGANLDEFDVGVRDHPDAIVQAAVEPGALRAIVYNTGFEGVASGQVTEWLERIRTGLPDAPIVLLSGREDPGDIIEAFRLGVRGYVPTSLTSDVVADAIRLVCAGGTFAPAARPAADPHDQQESSRSGRPGGPDRRRLGATGR